MNIKLLVLGSLFSLSAATFAQQAPPWSEELPIAAGLGQSGAPPQGMPPQSGVPQGEPVDEAGPGVARLSFLGGDVSVKRGDSGDAVAGALNAPLLVGDAIATGPAARAEVQFDGASRVRLGSEVEARVAELQPGKFRVEVAHGTVSLSVVRDTRAQTEISTPNVSMRPMQRGLYRITVGDDGQTSITVRYGQAEVYTQRGTEKISQGQTMMVRGSAEDPEFQIVAAVPKDDWDTWNEQRDQQLSHIKSYRYMNQDIEGGKNWTRRAVGSTTLPTERSGHRMSTRVGLPISRAVGPGKTIMVGLGSAQTRSVGRHTIMGTGITDRSVGAGIRELFIVPCSGVPR